MTKTSANAPPHGGAPPVLTDAETLLRAGSFHARLERARAQRAEALARLENGEAPRTARPGPGERPQRPGGPDGFILNPSRPFDSTDGDGLPVRKLFAQEAGAARPRPEPDRPATVASPVAQPAVNRGERAGFRGPTARPAFIGHAEEDARLAAEAAVAPKAEAEAASAPPKPQLVLVPTNLAAPATPAAEPAETVAQSPAIALEASAPASAATLLPLSVEALDSLDQAAARALAQPVTVSSGRSRGYVRGLASAAAVAALAIAGGVWFTQLPGPVDSDRAAPLAAAPLVPADAPVGKAPVLAAAAPAPLAQAPTADAQGAATEATPAPAQTDPRPLDYPPVTLATVAAPATADLAFAAPTVGGLAPVAAPAAPASITAPQPGLSQPHLLSASVPPSVSVVPPARASAAPAPSDVPPTIPPELTVRLLAPKGTAKADRQNMLNLLTAAGVMVGATEQADASATGPELRYFNPADQAAAKLLAAHLGLPPGAVRLLAGVPQQAGAFDLVVARPVPPETASAQPASAKPAKVPPGQAKKRAKKAGEATAMEALKTKILQQLQGTN